MSQPGGCEPTPKKQKTLLSEADRGQEYIKGVQPMRMPLEKISWHPMNRGGQEIMPFHVHEVGLDICTKGTSARRYGAVRLVEVPESEKAAWLLANKTKTKQNPL